MKRKKNDSFLARKIRFGFEKIAESISFVVHFFTTKSGELIYEFTEMKRKSKNLVQTNLDLAREHLQNNNIFDAKLRYKLVLKLDKMNFEALFGLGFIYFTQKNFYKSKANLSKALEICSNEEAKGEILKMLEYIETR
jgi:Tfp pilus assembly protein PilF